MKSWLVESGQFVILRCQIQPRASRTGLVGLHGEPPRLKIRIAAPPVDGEANVELISYLAKLLKIAKSRVEIAAGQAAKLKDVRLHGVATREVLDRLLAAGLTYPSDSSQPSA